MPGPEPDGSARGPATHAITLITGDRVLVVDWVDGTHQVTVEPGAGRERIQFFQRSGKDAKGQDRLGVVPVDAMPLIQAGRLDPRLFDISGLIRQGWRAVKD